MFSSHRIVSKKSPAYQAWLIGYSRKALKKQDLDINIDLLIEAVVGLGTNLQTISICALGIVKLYHEQASRLLYDCQKASESAKFFNKKKVEEKTEEIQEFEEIAKALKFAGRLTGLSEIDNPVENVEIPQAFPQNITLIENLPMKPQFDIMNFEDFGNAGAIDFSQVSAYIGNVEEPESKITENDIFGMPRETLDFNENLIIENPKLAQEDAMDIDLEPLNWKSLKKEQKRKNVWMCDEETMVGQTEMRENMNDYSNTLLADVDLAPPTRILMKIQEDKQWETLFTSIHLNGLKSTNGPVAKKIEEFYRFSMKHPMENSKNRYDESILFEEETEDTSINNWIDNSENREIEDEPEMMEIGVDDFFPDDFEKNDDIKEIVMLKCEEEEEKKTTLKKVLENYPKQKMDRKQAARVFMKILELLKLRIVEVMQKKPNGEICIIWM